MDWIRGERPALWRHLAGRTIGILGYGNQGRAQALNLRDNGIQHGFEVVVGARPGGAGEARARADRFECVTPAELALRTRIVVCLLPDEIHGEVLVRDVFPASLTGKRGAARAGEAPLLCLAHGFSLVFGGLVPPPEWDVVLAAPTGPGQQLRERFVAGDGLPGVAAAYQDASGVARDRALALAQGVGLLRRGIHWTTIENETVVDLFGEQAALCGGLIALTEAAFDTLVERGYPEELAYTECIEQISVTADLLSRFGPDGMRRRISPTALYGELTRGPRVINRQVRQAMAEVLDEVASGRFGREWMDDVARGRKRLRELLEKAGKHRASGTFSRLQRLRDGSSAGSSDGRP
ncbi:MAG: ketol-acid reductoisomerase [Candidatus Eisenbacteria bacterium]|nr:ketol-acid reductoisomerase [Candidatus Eisenbacteria bacterium]